MSDWWYWRPLQKSLIEYVQRFKESTDPIPSVQYELWACIWVIFICTLVMHWTSDNEVIKPTTVEGDVQRSWRCSEEILFLTLLSHTVSKGKFMSGGFFWTTPLKFSAADLITNELWLCICIKQILQQIHWFHHCSTENSGIRGQNMQRIRIRMSISVFLSVFVKGLNFFCCFAKIQM